MNELDERLVEKLVTYTVEREGRIYIVEGVPARVNEETGEHHFALSTVERLYEVILGEQEPDHVMRTTVYTYREKEA